MSAVTAEDVIKTRQGTHGEYADSARVMQAIKRAVREGAGYDDLPDIMKESLDMLAHKMGRIVTGNPSFHDHWVDISGYATLIIQRTDDGKGVKDEFERAPVEKPDFYMLLAERMRWPRAAVKDWWINRMCGGGAGVSTTIGAISETKFEAGPGVEALQKVVEHHAEAFRKLDDLKANIQRLSDRLERKFERHPGLAQPYGVERTLTGVVGQPAVGSRSVSVSSGPGGVAFARSGTPEDGGHHVLQAEPTELALQAPIAGRRHGTREWGEVTIERDDEGFVGKSPNGAVLRYSPFGQCKTGWAWDLVSLLPEEASVLVGVDVAEEGTDHSAMALVRDGRIEPCVPRRTGFAPFGEDQQ